MNGSTFAAVSALLCCFFSVASRCGRSPWGWEEPFRFYVGLPHVELRCDTLRHWDRARRRGVRPSASGSIPQGGVRNRAGLSPRRAEDSSGRPCALVTRLVVPFGSLGSCGFGVSGGTRGATTRVDTGVDFPTPPAPRQPRPLPALRQPAQWVRTATTGRRQGSTCLPPFGFGNGLPSSAGRE